MFKQTDKTVTKYELKHRLVGSLGIALFFIILIPLLLDENRTNIIIDPDRKQVELNQIQSEDGSAFVSTLKPVKVDTEASPSKPVLLDKKKNNTAITKNIDNSKNLKKTDKNTINNKQQPINGAWIVSVGVFIKPDNVKSILRKLKDNSFAVHQTAAETNVGKSTRVWLGPYTDRKSAERESARLVPLIGSKGWVTKQSM